MSAIIKTLKTKTDETEQSVYPKTVLEAVVDAETNQTLDVILDNLTVGTQSGTAYVDFNEQSGEVTGEVEKVTSASLVDYDNSTSGVAGSNVQEAIDELSNGKVNTSDIVDNLESTATDLPLSANQGAVLNNSLESLLGHFYSYGSVSGGTKHRIVEDLPTGIYFFVIADNTSTTVRSKPSMGIILFDTERKLAWINFQKSDDSTITNFTYSSTEGFVITTSISKYIHIDLINMTNFNPTIPLVTTT